MHLAYIDAQSGSMFLQLLLGGTAAAAVALKMWWRRVLEILHIRKPEEDAPAEPISAAHESEPLDSEPLDPVREPAGKR